MAASSDEEIDVVSSDPVDRPTPQSMKGRTPTGRPRGRPPKYPRGSRLSLNIPTEKVQADPPTETPMDVLPKAREEMPFLEVFPDMDPTKQILVARTNHSTDDFNIPDAETPRKLNLFTTITNLVNGIVSRVNSRKPSRAEIPSDSENVESLTMNDLDESLQGFPFAPQFHLAGPVLVSKYPNEVPIVKFKEDNRKSFAYTQTKFTRPENHFIRYAEPSEDEYEDICEYDMDEQDFCWLKVLNRERKSEDLPEITEDLFELVIDRLEKEWFHLTKDIIKDAQEPISHEESLCSICQDGEVDNSNAIVFCDGCNMAVHQEGPWLCRRCMITPDKPVSCIFCPETTGAFKQTTTNKWAHLLCSLWIPEVTIANPVYMEPIESIDRIPKSRWKLLCSICRKRGGACIQCSKSSCFTAYHVSCARKAGLYMKVKHQTVAGEQHTTYKSCCARHSPINHITSGSADGAEDSTMTDANSSVVTIEPQVGNPGTTWRAIISQSSPVVPEFMFKNIYTYLDDKKYAIRQKGKFLIAVCKYWSLKRKHRRGAPLLKRLHIEPWTVFSSSIRQNEHIQLIRYKILDCLRDDLESVRTLIDLIKRREKEKLKLLRAQLDSNYMILCPLNCILRRTLEALKSYLFTFANDFRIDKNNFFLDFVDPELVPDYYDIVKSPMCFNKILEKIENFEYSNVDEFEDDVKQIVINSLIYNKKETPYAKQAVKLDAEIPKHIEKARKSMDCLPIDYETGCLEGYLRVEPQMEVIEEEVEKPKSKTKRRADDSSDGEEKKIKSSGSTNKRKRQRRKDGKRKRSIA